MIISNAYVRFYKSFNFDYLRKTHEDAVPDLWDTTEDGQFYPFVRVPLERDITTVVGANESGKSQLLSAIMCALTGKDIERGDFCRYSQFFAVDRSMAYPDFGLGFYHLTDADREALIKVCDATSEVGLDAFAVFRFGGRPPTVYIRELDKWVSHKVLDESALNAMLPRPFMIDAEVPLPDSVPIAFLTKGKLGNKLRARGGRLKALNALVENEPWFESQASITSAAPQIHEALSSAESKDPMLRAKLNLADQLLTKVAKIDRSAFGELLLAVEGDAEGYANGIVEKLNQALANSLNFPKWWSQDRRFQLLVTLRDADLVFTIRDRTGTEYSFSERSGGLKYFLSYFVQHLAHEPPSAETSEILLMDEPDAFLSSTGQQDLLRIFEEFAHPSGNRPPCQVVYVTHSPFLIDKNHGERLRVLEKGEGDEGTRVVRNAARNHYEPLRSALGGFVGETTFISNCNLMLEGMSDQVILAGMSARLRKIGAPNTENLDLNSVTLVPAGSASQVPYLVFLARGRDVDRPAVIVLLDGDSAGDEALRTLQRGGPRNKQLLDPTFILQLGDSSITDIASSNPTGVKEIEDLIPLEIALEAVAYYVAEFVGPEEARLTKELSPGDVDFSDDLSTHDALERAVAARIGEGFHLDKLGFARGVIHVVTQATATPTGPQEIMDANFRALFQVLGQMKRNASRDAAREKAGTKIKRAKRGFFLDHPEGATREQVILLLEDIASSLDDSTSAEELEARLRAIRRKHELDNELTQPIENYAELRSDLEALVYVETQEAQQQVPL